MHIATTFAGVFLCAYGTALLASAVLSAKGPSATRRATLGSLVVAAGATLVAL